MNMQALAPYLLPLLLSTVMHLLPKLTRPDLFLGVTVAPGFRDADAGRRMLRRFRLVLWSLTAAVIAASVFSQRTYPLLAVYFASAFAAVAVFHHAALKYAVKPSPVVEVDLAAPAERMPGGWIVAALPLLVLAVLGVWANAQGTQLPANLAVHWNLLGADRWVATTPHAVFALLARAALSCLLLAAVALAVLHGSRRIWPAGAHSANERRFRRRIVLLILVAEYSLCLPPVFSLLQAPHWLTLGGSLALLLTMVGLGLSLMLMGQGGSRNVASAQRLPIGDRTADQRWLLGMIYFNRADPALLVEKRMGIGYTLNFGNPWCWLALTAVLTLPALLRWLGAQ